MCPEYYGHTRATMLVIVLKAIVTMAMVVMGGMCVQSITAIRTIISNLLCWKLYF